MLTDDLPWTSPVLFSISLKMYCTSRQKYLIFNSNLVSQGLENSFIHSALMKALSEECMAFKCLADSLLSVVPSSAGGLSIKTLGRLGF